MLEYFQDVVMLELSMARVDKSQGHHAGTVQGGCFKHRACICSSNVSLHQDVGREVGARSSRVGENDGGVERRVKMYAMGSVNLQ